MENPATAPAHWWDIIGALGPVAILLAALSAGVIAWLGLRQRSRADRRSEWWTRAQWALDASLSTDLAKKETGLGVLKLLAESKMAGTEELEIISIAWTRPLAGAGARMDDAGHLADSGITDEGKGDGLEHTNPGAAGTRE